MTVHRGWVGPDTRSFRFLGSDRGGRVPIRLYTDVVVGTLDSLSDPSWVTHVRRRGDGYLFSNVLAIRRVGVGIPRLNIYCSVVFVK